MMALSDFLLFIVLIYLCILYSWDYWKCSAVLNVKVFFVVIVKCYTRFIDWEVHSWRTKIPEVHTQKRLDTRFIYSLLTLKHLFPSSSRLNCSLKFFRKATLEYQTSFSLCRYLLCCKRRVSDVTRCLRAELSLPTSGIDQQVFSSNSRQTKKGTSQQRTTNGF